MYQLDLKGISSVEIGERLVLPFSFIEMLRSPWGIRIDANELYRSGGEINRWLLDNTPLRHNRKYVNCYITIHYLAGSLIHVPTSDWHCDGSGFPPDADDIFHTMVGLGDGIDGQIKTEFLDTDKSLTIEDSVNMPGMNHVEFRRYMTENSDKFSLNSVEAESGRIHTWTSKHLHRVQFPKQPHFRLFWKVAESDHLMPLPSDVAYRPHAKAIMGNNGAETMNIEQGPRGIILRGIDIRE
ncbi:hypothetical protein [Paenibacillus xylanexedens]|uniref:hypothetical protein n=1 Tax=Paenibacillus xylanexedens TaxID=528191 RepID=UPI000F53DC8B|nr:hypothetical protein [Paenibacillus xylanexedens]RPK20048.1 hypothetical protein EDO6_06565 [Paenibacillus xylanexedens]